MSRASRLQRIEVLLLNTPDGYTTQELAEKLNVHRTTIWRDLDEVSCEVPIQKIGDRYLIDRTEYLSSVRLSRAESLMLYIAMRRMLRHPTHIPPMMIPALEKLAISLRRPSATQLIESIQAMRAEKSTNPERAQLWEALVQAWLERITVRITYQDLRSQNLETYEVHPYLFEPAVLGEGVYLIGHSLTHNALEAFKVERIANAVLTTQRFVRPDDVVVDAILRRVWGNWYSEELTEVCLRFHPKVASRVRDIVWLPSQEVRDLPDGGIEWSIRVTDVRALVLWIRSWGSDCEVLTPLELREHIAEMEHYTGDGIMATVETPQVSLNETFYDSLHKMVGGERIRTCLQCGSCSGICPFGYLMDFSPRRIIAALRAGMFTEVMDTDTVWMCVSCYACTEVCPENIPLTLGLMTRAKEELLLAGNIPTELRDALENSQRYGNPLGESPRKRANWVKDLEPEVTIMGKAKRPVDILWFVGDYASYHPRVQLASKALVKVFNTLGVDFGILGPEEYSDGDSQRLAGEHGLFEMLAEKNGRALRKYTFNEIITTDPHAYNALKNEYPALGIIYPVQHYTQFLAERLDQLKPLLKQEIAATVTFHDPCYLGRANGVYEEPRALLKAIPGVELIEMSHHHETSLCCGGGGGGMWLDGFQWEKAEVRLSEWRVREAMNAAPEEEFITIPEALRKGRHKHKCKTHSESTENGEKRILAVACPYEAPRFEDAAKTIEGAEQLVVKDIAELLAEAMGH